MANVSIIAGYDVLAFESKDHIAYVRESYQRAVREGVNYIILIGGKTNPDYPALTEAEANRKIIDEHCPRDEGFVPDIIVLPVGNTAAEGLKAAKKWIIENRVEVGLLFLCAEQSRLTGFMIDALQVGLSDYSKRIAAYGHSFPESAGNFQPQREKLLMKVLSNKYWIFNLIQLILQKRHQRKVAKLKTTQLEHII